MSPMGFYIDLLEQWDTQDDILKKNPHLFFFFQQLKWLLVTEIEIETVIEILGCPVSTFTLGRNIYLSGFDYTKQSLSSLGQTIFRRFPKKRKKKRIIILIFREHPQNFYSLYQTMVPWSQDKFSSKVLSHTPFLGKDSTCSFPNGGCKPRADVICSPSALLKFAHVLPASKERQVSICWACSSQLETSSQAWTQGVLLGFQLIAKSSFRLFFGSTTTLLSLHIKIQEGGQMVCVT